MLGLFAAAVLAAGGYDGGHELCHFNDRAISESSGLVVGVRSDLLFTHNDSGDTARFFAVDRTCRTRATYRLRGIQARDWEDISRGPGGTLWLADIGDNKQTRDRGVLVHRVAEPLPGSPASLTATTFRLRYMDGPHDAEALMVTRSGQVLIVTKSVGSRADIYSTQGALRSGGAVNSLHRVGAAAVSLVTAGDISPDGTRVVLRNYAAAYEWDVRSGDVVAALEGEPTRIPLPPSQQGEGIAYDRDGTSLLTSSEGVAAPVDVLRRTASGAATSGGPRPVADRNSKGHTLLPQLVGPLAVLLVALLLGLRRVRRRR